MLRDRKLTEPWERLPYRFVAARFWQASLLVWPRAELVRKELDIRYSLGGGCKAAFTLRSEIRQRPASRGERAPT
jgi:hypothetical protein